MGMIGNLSPKHSLYPAQIGSNWTNSKRENTCYLLVEGLLEEAALRQPISGPDSEQEARGLTRRLCDADLLLSRTECRRKRHTESANQI